MIRNVIDWLEERTGIETAVKVFMYEEIPGSSGWHQVFGSIAMFLFLTQVFTGIMLAFNYAPTPGEAYNSLKYIVTELTAGRLMRGLHHWGASMTIVIVVLHMVQVFLWGAYKKPREGTWVVGCILLLLTLAYGLTGYLLQWDNRAYWGTVVTTQIGATVPVMGPYVSRLLASTGDIGVVTFARFYGMHVLLLPPATFLLIAVHIYLVRRHGVTPAPGDELKPRKAFYPEQVFKDTIAVFIAFAILFTMAIAVKVPLERMADPTDTSYIPRPEWYFLFLFQTLKAFEGPLEVVGTVVLPTVGILALILAPFVDRGKAVRVRQRTMAFGIVLLAAAGWGGLTLAASRSTPAQSEAARIDFSGPTQWMQLKPGELAGIASFRKENCAACHNVIGDTPKRGPNLSNTARRHDAAWMRAHFEDPPGVSAGSVMTPVNLEEPLLKDLVSFVMILTAENSDVMDAPGFAVDGAALYQKNNCAACHMVNGAGGRIGPSLNGIGSRRTESWATEHFLNPQKLSPGTPMPPYSFGPAELQNIVSYLFTLPDIPPVP